MPVLSRADQPLSEAVRAASQDAHGEAEQAPFVTALLAGRQPLERYARLLVQHRAVYAALEGAVPRLAHQPELRPFLDDVLWRLPALEADVVALLGTGWQGRPGAALLPATLEYRERLLEVGTTWPAGWLAHHYVRYLGDLSGGQHIRRRVEDVYGIDATCGTACFDFPGIPSPERWKGAYRAHLDALPWGPEERASFTAEVLEGYRLSSALFEQLSATGG